MTDPEWTRSLAAMEPATTLPAQALERLTWDEIGSRYPDEWVMMVDVDWVNEDDPDFRTAIVVGHGKTRREVSLSTREAMRAFSDGACMFTGRLVPEGPVYLSPLFRR